MTPFALSVILIINAHTKDPWWAKDKALHFGVSFVVSTGTYMLFKNCSRNPRTEAFGLTVSLGIMKEIYDWKLKRKFFSYKDLFFDITGAIHILFK